MGKYLHKYTSESAFTQDYNGENYHEPWVSLTKDIENVSRFVVNCSNAYYFYADYEGPENGAYKWRASAVEGQQQQPYDDYYWTTTRNPETGDSVFCSFTGISQNNPCATVSAITSYMTENRVDYNKAPSYAKVLWNELGNTDAPEPTKVLVFNGNDQQTYQFFYDQNIIRHNETTPIGGHWYDFTNTTANTVYDIDTMTESDLDGIDYGGVFFMWELDENGFPEGVSEYSDGYYEINNGVLSPSGSFDKYCTKIDNKFYGWMCYGD